MAKYGFVYLLSNDSMPGIYKIGFTKNSPLDRAYELSRSTSCPTPFEVVCYAELENPQEVERGFHEQFIDYRVNDLREFFRFSIDDLITYACYSICTKEESGAINYVLTDKYHYFHALFQGADYLNLSPDEIIK